MTAAESQLLLDFLRWLGTKPRRYGDVMDAWRSTCPRATVWEDALLAGFIQIKSDGGSMSDAIVTLTPAGVAASARPPS